MDHFTLHPQDHDFGGLDEGSRSLTGFEIHFAGRACGDDRGDLLVANREYDLRHEPTDANTLDAAHQLISSAETTHEESALGRSLGSRPE